MALGIFGDKKAPLARLKRGDFRSQEELRELFGELYQDEGLRIGDLVWMLTDNNRDLRTFAGQLVRARQLPGTFAAVWKEALHQSGPQQRMLLQILPELNDPEAVDTLIEAIRSGRGDAKRVAADALLTFPVARVFPYLVGFLRSDDDELRYRGLSRLAEGIKDGQDLDPKLRAVITQVTQDPVDRVRMKAFSILAAHPDEAFIELILDRIRHERYTVKKQLVGILENTSLQSGSRILDSLVPLLGEGDDLIRNAALKIATRSGDPKEVIRRIILYSKSLMGWMRDRIHQTISEFGDELLDPIIELMGHEDPEIRSSALLFAVNHQSPKLIRPCIRLLGDQDWWTRVVAMDALGTLKAQEAVEPLIRCLGDPDLRWSAVESLTRIGSPAALGHIAKLLGDPASEVRLEVIHAMEVFNDPRSLNLLQKVYQRDPELEVRERAMEAFKHITAANNIKVDDEAMRRDFALTATSDKAIDRLLVQTRRMGASDFHLTPDSEPVVRLHGTLQRLGDRRFTAEETTRLVREMLDPRQAQRFAEQRQLDLCYEIRGAGRYRANVYHERNGMAAVFRVIPNEVPNFHDTRIPEHLSDIAHYHQGLVIVSGAAGSGKTTTLAALINLLNETKRHHIITLEDPIEFVHPFKNCLINQRETGRHTQDFPTALRAALREDPDVIVVGEMRDIETMRLAITAAETGHLVIGTMHTTNAAKTVGRLIDAFPPREQAQVRIMLSETLKLVMNQALVPRADGNGRVPAFEVLMVTHAVSNQIRENKLTMLPSLMTIGRNVGMRTFDDALMHLVEEKLISAEDAYLRARDKELFEPLVSRDFLEGAHV